jgi:glycosyltransferase involved in cell wall biosynthesis
MVQRINSVVSRLLSFVRVLLINIFEPIKVDLLILDDIYPLPISGFRSTEFGRYLDVFENSLVLTTGSALPIVGETRNINSVIAEYYKQHQHHDERIVKYHYHYRVKARLAYIVFLGNAFGFNDFLTKNSLPFVFTLYPGGGFKLDDEWSDHMLKTVCSSPLFRKVIVTQKNTYDYLLKKNFCAASSIEFIYGVVPSSSKQNDSRIECKREIKNTKEVFNVCFVAHKYMPRGVDKGYDTFVSAAMLCAAETNVHFHVVGNFDENDINVSAIPCISFYGQQKKEFFEDFYKKMDVIVAPSVPFISGAGAFDGFPTGCCVDAGLQGVVAICSDVLGQNIHFTDERDIVLVNNDAREIADKITYYKDNREDLVELSTASQLKFKALFDIESQMAPRIQLIKQLLNA